MSEYVRLSRLVDKAITSRDAELAKTLRHELQLLQDEDRYKLLASRLDLIPEEEPTPPQDDANEHSRKRQAPREMTLKDAHRILEIHRWYIQAHNDAMSSTTKSHRRYSKARVVQMKYERLIRNIGPVYLSFNEKLARAHNLTGIQEEGELGEIGSLVMSPQFKGGHKLSGGLPGSKR